MAFREECMLKPLVQGMRTLFASPADSPLTFNGEQAIAVINRRLMMKRSIGDVACCAVIIVLCLYAGLPRYRCRVDFRDEGFLAYGAVRVMEGQVPNRDFVSLQPPLSFYSIAAVFKLFGTSLASLRAAGLVVYILIPVVLYAITRHRAGKILSLATALPAAVFGIAYFHFVPYAVWQGELAALLTIFFLLRAAATELRRWSILAGVANAATVLLRHDQGAYLIGAVIVYFFAVRFTERDAVGRRTADRMILFWAASMAATMLPLIVYWISLGAAASMVKQLVVFPLTRYAATSSLSFPAFVAGSSLTKNLSVALFYIPPVIELLATIWLLRLLIRRCFSVEHSQITFILAVSIFFYLQALTRSDMYHLLITLPPLFVLCGWLVGVLSNATEAAVQKRHGQFLALFSKRAVPVAAGLIVGPFLLVMMPIFLPSPAGASRQLLLDRGGVYLNPEDAEHLERIVKILQSKAAPDKPILALPYNPMFYFLTERRNPTRWNYLWPGDQTPEEHQALINQARSDPPEAVVLEREYMLYYAPLIVDYVHTEYDLAYTAGKLRIYFPKASLRKR